MNSGNGIRIVFWPSALGIVEHRILDISPWRLLETFPQTTLERTIERELICPIRFWGKIRHRHGRQSFGVVSQDVVSTIRHGLVAVQAVQAGG